MIRASRPGPSIDLAAARDLATAGRYDEVGQALREGGLAGEAEAASGGAALVVAAAQLCASGAQCREEADFHARACAAAVGRERELRVHLDHVLDLLGGGVPVAVPAGRPVDGSGAGAELVAFCLGPFRLYQRSEAVIGWRGSKCQAVLRYLLLHRRRRIPKEVLMDLLWPESGGDAARRNLHQAVYSLRQVLRRGGRDVGDVCFAEDCYFLDPELSIWLDHEEFESRAERGELLGREGRSHEAIAELAAAEQLYGGDLFEDHPYDEWVIGERERLRALRHRVVSRLSAHHAERGDHDAAIALCQRLLLEDSCDEDTHRRLICSYLAQGRRGLAAQQYRACQEVLRRELGVEPSSELASLAGAVSGLSAA